MAARVGTPVEDPASSKLRGVFAAFAELGAQAEPVVYDDARVDAVRSQLLALDGVLVWVNPIEHGRDRSLLDPLLRAAAAAGVFVSAHPDVILRMGDEAGARRHELGTPTRVFRSGDDLRAGLDHDRVVVLKQCRGMGGDGVWKVERVGRDVREVQLAFPEHACSDAAQAALERIAERRFLAPSASQP